MHRNRRHNNKTALSGAFVALAMIVSGCSSTTANYARDERDPWQGFNRKVFAFNETADKYVAKPAAQAYDAVMPSLLQDGVGNMFDNARELINIFNDLLQWKLGDAAVDSGRFLINSSVGVLGFFEVAGHIGMPREAEDFGQTLGYWGVESGPYLVLPILGPSTVRDAAGIPVDSLPDAVNWIGHDPTQTGVRIWRLVDQRAGLLETEQLISGDKYTFLRDAYLQRRKYLINDGKMVEDGFGDEDFGGFEDW